MILSGQSNKSNRNKILPHWSRLPYLVRLAAISQQAWDYQLFAWRLTYVFAIKCRLHAGLSAVIQAVPLAALSLSFSSILSDILRHIAAVCSGSLTHCVQFHVKCGSRAQQQQQKEERVNEVNSIRASFACDPYRTFLLRAFLLLNVCSLLLQQKRVKKLQLAKGMRAHTAAHGEEEARAQFI